MYTIKLNNDKTLETTVKTTLMQKENGVDKIQFLIPPEYEEQDLSDYIITLVWFDTNDNMHTELLERDLETYRDYIRCVYTATREFLSQAGEIEVHLNMMNPDLSDDIPYKILRSCSTVIRVNKPGSYADFADYETLEAMKQKMKELSNSMPTDLVISEDDNLHLVHEETQIGNGVEIISASNPDDQDGTHDGVIEIHDEDTVEPVDTSGDDEVDVGDTGHDPAVIIEDPGEDIKDDDSDITIGDEENDDDDNSPIIIADDETDDEIGDDIDDSDDDEEVIIID